MIMKTKHVKYTRQMIRRGQIGKLPGGRAQIAGGGVKGQIAKGSKEQQIAKGGGALPPFTVDIDRPC